MSQTFALHGAHCSPSLPVQARVQRQCRGSQRAASLLFRAQHKQEHDEPVSHSSRRQLLARLVSGLAAVSLAAAPALEAKEAFLESTGARGPLAEEEARLLMLRAEAEEGVRKELNRARLELEQEGATTQAGKLCATPFGVDIVGITEFVALLGALVGGASARQRKAEVERLNDQLRKINLSLRQQARAGTIYAPGLTYAPRDPAPDDAEALLQGLRFSEGASASGTAVAEPLAPPQANGFASSSAASLSSLASIASMDEAAGFAGPLDSAMSTYTMDEDELSPEAAQCLAALKEGKRLLKAKQGASAMVRFEKALMLAKFVNNKVQERRAVRGLAAAARIQGQYRAAIKHLERVLEISGSMEDHVGDADAYGTIADIYTDMGELDRAADYYDKYISTMNSEGTPV